MTTDEIKTYLELKYHRHDIISNTGSPVAADSGLVAIEYIFYSSSKRKYSYDWLYRNSGNVIWEICPRFNDIRNQENYKKYVLLDYRNPHRGNTFESIYWSDSLEDIYYQIFIEEMKDDS